MRASSGSQLLCDPAVANRTVRREDRLNIERKGRREMNPRFDDVLIDVARMIGRADDEIVGRASRQVGRS
jgi:hypothetical protein